MLVPPRSGVGASASALSTACSSAVASSKRPRPWKRSSATDRSIAAGFAIPWPAICGAEPWTGSKIPGPSSPSEAEAASPRPPVTAAATSERMSPNVFSVTTVSIVSGAWTIVIANESTSA